MIKLLLFAIGCYTVALALSQVTMWHQHMAIRRTQAELARLMTEWKLCSKRGEADDDAGRKELK